LRRPQFDRHKADFLAKAASQAQTVTYAEFAARFGLANQGCGKVLTEMGERLRAEKLPLLPVLVVNKKTGLPSGDAEFYKRLGLDQDGVREEQQKCFAHDWTTASFWSAEE
jgi:hypothetical protein